MGGFFTFLYPLVALISILGYLPQIRSLLSAERQAQAMSIRCWVLWSVANFISFGYSTFALQDFLLSATSLLNMTMSLVVTVLIIYNRYVTFGNYKNLFEASIEYFLFKPYFGVREIKVPVVNKVIDEHDFPHHWS